MTREETRKVVLALPTQSNERDNTGVRPPVLDTLASHMLMKANKCLLRSIDRHPAHYQHAIFHKNMAANPMEAAATPILRPAPPSPGVWVGAPPPPVRVQVPLGEPDGPLVVVLLGVVVGAPRCRGRPVVETGIMIWCTVHGTMWTGRCMKERRSEIWSALVSSR